MRIKYKIARYYQNIMLYKILYCLFCAFCTKLYSGPSAHFVLKRVYFEYIPCTCTLGCFVYCIFSRERTKNTANKNVTFRYTSWLCLSLKSPNGHTCIGKFLQWNILANSCMHCVPSNNIIAFYMYHKRLSGVSLSLTMIASRVIVMTTNVKCACPLQRHRHKETPQYIVFIPYFVSLLSCYWLDVTKYIVELSSSLSLLTEEIEKRRKKHWCCVCVRYVCICKYFRLYVLKKHSIL